jgi:hypothetical protein
MWSIFAKIVVLVVIVVIFVIAYRAIFVSHRAHLYGRKRSAADGESYKVITSFSGDQEAANLLGEINGRITILMRAIKQKLANNKFGTDDALYLTHIIRNYAPDRVDENFPVSADEPTSYNVDNGKQISLCLRKTAHEFHDINLILFVAIHEIAHIYPVVRDPVTGPHTALFWYIDRLLLQEAVEAGVYAPTNYRQTPVSYCNGGIALHTSPLFPN